MNQTLQETKMNRFGSAAIVLIALVVSCGGNNTGDTPANNREERITVEVSRATLGDMTIYRDYTGTLEGVEQAVLLAKVAETVTGIRIRPGDRVNEGDLLILLEKSGPSSNFRQAEAYYGNAKKTFDKMKYLYDEGAISEQQYDNAKTEFQVAEANFKAARDLVEISSPIAGVVTDLRVNIGDQTMNGQKLATVSRVDSLRLTAGVDPEEVGYIELGMTARVYPVGQKNDWIEGVVTRVASSADPKTRAFEIEITVANTESSLKPGSFAGCTIPLRELSGIVKVPDESILLREGLKKIYIVQRDSAWVTDIVTGESSDGYTQIVSGVNAGDMVVTVGHAFLQDRNLVTIGGEEADEQ
jgi:RND family efflux transporter MFP subunit